jgi:hypothetical protein
MNRYAYPVILEHLKKNTFVFFIVGLGNGDVINIIKQNGFIFVDQSQSKVMYTEKSMDIYCDKSINDIMILYDNSGPSYKMIYYRCYTRAAVVIQRAWRNRGDLVVSGEFIKVYNPETVKVLKR